MLKIGALWKPLLAPALQIHFRCSVMRFAGHSSEEISAGVYFLNYGITWDTAEKVFKKLSEDASACSLISTLFQSHEKLIEGVNALKALPTAVNDVRR